MIHGSVVQLLDVTTHAGAICRAALQLQAGRI
jgi:hypothetical protein